MLEGGGRRGRRKEEKSDEKTTREGSRDAVGHRQVCLPTNTYYPPDSASHAGLNSNSAYAIDVDSGEIYLYLSTHRRGSKPCLCRYVVGRTGHDDQLENKSRLLIS